MYGNENQVHVSTTAFDSVVKAILNPEDKQKVLDQNTYSKMLSQKTAPKDVRGKKGFVADCDTLAAINSQYGAYDGNAYDRSLKSQDAGYYHVVDSNGKPVGTKKTGIKKTIARNSGVWDENNGKLTPFQVLDLSLVQDDFTQTAGLPSNLLTSVYRAEIFEQEVMAKSYLAFMGDTRNIGAEWDDYYVQFFSKQTSASTVFDAQQQIIEPYSDYGNPIGTDVSYNAWTKLIWSAMFGYQIGVKERKTIARISQSLDSDKMESMKERISQVIDLSGWFGIGNLEVLGFINNPMLPVLPSPYAIQATGYFNASDWYSFRQLIHSIYVERGFGNIAVTHTLRFAMVPKVQMSDTSLFPYVPVTAGGVIDEVFADKIFPAQPLSQKFNKSTNYMVVMAEPKGIGTVAFDAYVSELMSFGTETEFKNLKTKFGIFRLGPQFIKRNMIQIWDLGTFNSDVDESQLVLANTL